MSNKSLFLYYFNLTQYFQLRTGDCWKHHKLFSHNNASCDWSTNKHVNSDWFTVKNVNGDWSTVKDVNGDWYTKKHLIGDWFPDKRVNSDWCADKRVNCLSLVNIISTKIKLNLISFHQLKQFIEYLFLYKRFLNTAKTLPHQTEEQQEILPYKLC